MKGSLLHSHLVRWLAFMKTRIVIIRNVPEHTLDTLDISFTASVVKLTCGLVICMICIE